MTKKQEIFIESFRHRRVSAEIGKTAKEVSQFTNSGGSSLISSGGLDSDCYTPGGYGNVDTPCPPRTTLRADNLDECGPNATQFSINRCDFTGKLSSGFQLEAGRNSGGGTSQTECSSAGHAPRNHYWKQVARFLVLDEITNKWAIKAKANWAPAVGSSVSVDFYINCSTDLFDLNCETDLTKWTEGDYAGTITFNFTNLDSGRNYDNNAKTLIFEVPPDTEWIRYELPDTDSLPEGHFIQLLDPDEDFDPPIGPDSFDWNICTVDTDVFDITDYSDTVDFNSGGFGNSTGCQAPIETPNGFPGTGGWWVTNCRDDTTVPITVPSFKARNCFAGFFMQSHDEEYAAFYDQQSVPFERWYSGARACRQDYNPATPEEIFLRFAWVELPTNNAGVVQISSHFGTSFGGIGQKPLLIATPSEGFAGDPRRNGYIQVGTSHFAIPWFQNKEYSIRLLNSASNIQAKVWLSEDTEPASYQVFSTATTTQTGGLNIQIQGDFYSSTEQRMVIKFIYIAANGIAVFDCNRVKDSEGNQIGQLDEFGFPMFDLSGEFGFEEDTQMSATLIRVTESRYVLPSDAEQIQNLWIDGAHAEPNTHYTFTPPRTVLLTHTMPVGTKITAQYLGIGGTI